jgi:5-methylcytosine-specific restriction endonuclease McrA
LRNYNDPIYKKMRKKVLRRDGFKCQMPNCKKRKRLHIHHIVRWADAAVLRYEEWNMITLCRTCHESIKNKESHFASMFQEIVSRRK